MKKNKIFLLLIAFAAAIFLFTSGHYEVDDKGNKTWVADYHGDNPPEEDSSSNGNSSDEHNDDDGSNSSSSSSSTPSTPPPPPPEPQYPDPTENMEDEDLQIIAENGTAVQKAEAQRILEQHRFNAENLRLEEACFDYSEIVEQIEEEQKENPPAPEPEEVPAQEEINQEVALIQEIQEQQEIEKQKTIQQNNEEIKEEEIAENSDDAGDPVLVTQGVYEQNEKDIGFIQTGGFYVYRKYLSDKNVISSFGSGWSTNLDERIILGTDSRSEEYIEKLAQGGEHIQQLIRQYEAELAAAYGVSDIYSAQSEYTERITSANASKASQQQLKVHLDNVGEKKVKNFSLGMKQRLGIALALMNHPKLMLLDEPMNGLDPEGIAELRELLIELNQKEGITVLISSHILSELEKIASCYGFISHGKLLEEITAEGLQAKCRKSVNVKVSDVAKTEAILNKLNIKDYKAFPSGDVKIYENIAINDFVVALSNEGITVLGINSQEESVEEYYLNLIKEGK